MSIWKNFFKKSQPSYDYVFLFKEQSEQPLNMEIYSREILEDICPEALSAGTNICAETASKPGPLTEMYALARIYLIEPHLMMRNKEYDIITQKFTDQYDVRGLLVKYKKK